MSSYKPDQGRMARMAAFWSCVLLSLFGCTSLYALLASQFDALREPLAGIVIPVIGVRLSGAFLITSVLFAVLVVVIHRWQARPKSADLLIETEGELRKVTWPTLEEVINSSVVVIAFVLALMAYLAGADYILGRVFTRILLGG